MPTEPERPERAPAVTVARRLFAFPCGHERFDAAVLDAFDERVGSQIQIPYFLFVVEHDDAIVLFDTGVHPDLAIDPRRRLGDDADKWQISVSEHELADRLLATIGVRASAVTHVVLSHLHYDHAGGLCVFPDARLVVQRTELDYARRPPVFQQDLYDQRDFELPGEWQLLDGECDLLGDGAIVLFPTPGHTAGHQSMQVRLSGGDLILAADAAYTPKHLASRRLPTGSLVWRSDAAVDSYEELERRIDATHAGLICSHDPDYRLSVRVAPDRHYS